MHEIACGTIYEYAFGSNAVYANPLTAVGVAVTFTSPLGQRQTVAAFWDGGGTWRVRFCPEQPGVWLWRSACSNSADGGLHGQAGEFRCTPYRGGNPLYLHGSLRLSADRHSFVHRDGTPFFWLADTAWNGPLKAHGSDWERYLATRARQRFTAVQFVTTQWRAHQEARAYVVTEGLHVLPEHFRRLDGCLAKANEAGPGRRPGDAVGLRPRGPRADVVA